MRVTETGCTRANGCFEKINQEGAFSENETASIYPKAKAGSGEEEELEKREEIGWAEEMSLDLDMVSAVCPECKLLLVEADNSLNVNLDKAEDEGAAFKEGTKFPGTNVISDSWVGFDESSDTERDVYFDHPGIPVVAAAGDEGYGVRYPAASKYVIAVGGTELTKEKEPFKTERHWTEKGCATSEVRMQQPRGLER